MTLPSLPSAAVLAPWLAHPLVLLGLFVLASTLMIWRLGAVERKGFEGTVLGSLITPYCSGFANLVFAFVMSRTAGNGRLVIENSIVNNVTNLTLILGVATLLFAPAASAVAPARAARKPKSALAARATRPVAGGDGDRLDRLDLLFSLVALFLFTGTLWALGRDGVIDFADGLVLVGLFVFWQVLHVFEVLKNNVRKNRSLHWSIAIDLLLIAAAAGAIYLSVDRLVEWVARADGRIFSFANLGWLSGVLMVLPNAVLALHYGRAGRQAVVVSSQVGDSHICIPMCVGLIALFEPIAIPGFFQVGVWLILGAGIVHFLALLLFGRLPRWLGGLLIAAYGGFLWVGLAG